MIVNSHLFEAFLECSTKCWLRSRAEPTAGNTYAEWARAQSKAYYEDGLKRLLAMFPESNRAIAAPISENLKDATWRVIGDIRLSTNNLELHLQAVERMPSEGRAGSISSSHIVLNSLTNLPKTISCRSRSTRTCSPKPLDVR